MGAVGLTSDWLRGDEARAGFNCLRNCRGPKRVSCWLRAGLAAFRAFNSLSARKADPKARFLCNPVRLVGLSPALISMRIYLNILGGGFTTFAMPCRKVYAKHVNIQNTIDQACPEYPNAFHNVSELSRKAHVKYFIMMKYWP